MTTYAERLADAVNDFLSMDRESVQSIADAGAVVGPMGRASLVIVAFRRGFSARRLEAAVVRACRAEMAHEGR